MALERKPAAGGNGTIPKSIRRQIEIPLKMKDNSRVVSKHPRDKISGFVGNEIIYPTDEHRRGWCINDKENANKRYSVPQMNTVLDLAHQMDELNIRKPPKFKTTGDLTPRSKAIVLPQITKKLNFPLDKQIFKNLIPINVNDSILLPEKKQSIRKKYVSAKSKIPVPDLADFLEPLSPLVLSIPEPEIRIEHPQTEFDYFVDFSEFHRSMDACLNDYKFTI